MIAPLAAAAAAGCLLHLRNAHRRHRRAGEARLHDHCRDIPHAVSAEMQLWDRWEPPGE